MSSKLSAGTSTRSYGCTLVALLTSTLLLGAAEDGGDTEAFPSLASLPQPVASFGATIADGRLYVLGGHTGTAHDHSRANLVDGFWSLAPGSEAGWQRLADPTVVQGTAIVAHSGAIYHFGGMEARNATTDEDEDLHSLAIARRYDPEAKAWQDLTPLPRGRSSHDAAVYGDHVYILGGWTLAGDEKPSWIPAAWRADLSADELVWEELPEQPYRRRALAVAAAHDRVYAIGGINEDGDVCLEVSWFDIPTGQWHHGPDLPIENRLEAFGACAFGHRDAIYAMPSDGRIYKLAKGAEAWEDTGHAVPARFFSRLLPHGDKLYVLGGAVMRQGHTDEVLVIDLAKPPHALPQEKEADMQAEPAPQAVVPERTWPGFRGDGSGRLQDGSLPTTWDDAALSWRRDLIGYGQSSPVIWGDRCYVTSSLGTDKEVFVLACHALATGEPLWTRHFVAPQPAQAKRSVAKAAPTPIAGPHGVYAFGEGGNVVACSHTGEVRWQRDLPGSFGAFDAGHGIAASPVLADTGLVLLVDHRGPSYLLCLDRDDGRTVWKTHHAPRMAWSSPVLADHAAGPEIVISSNGVVEGYGPDGQRRWQIDGLEANYIPSPVVHEDLIVVGASEAGHCRAFRRKADGVEQVWASESATTGYCSPLVVGDAVYLISKKGLLRCLALADGTERWQFELPEKCTASPIGDGTHVYCFGQHGTTTVLAVGGSEPAVVASNSLGIAKGTELYGVAAADGLLLFRSGSELLCLGAPVEEERVAEGSGAE